MKELANEFKRKFDCLGENTEKCKTVSVPIEKEIKKLMKMVMRILKTISYKVKFIDSARFMVSSLSNLVDNLAKGIHEIKCKDCNCFLEYENVNDNLTKYKL